MNIKIFKTKLGQEPFTQWMESLKDKTIKARIQQRLRRAETGNKGIVKAVGDGIWEFKMDFGPGYRIYFIEEEIMSILLLYGGDKSSQKRDIEQAKLLAKEYKENRDDKI